MCMGIYVIVLLKNLVVVIFVVIIGIGIGLFCYLGIVINYGVVVM